MGARNRRNTRRAHLRWQQTTYRLHRALPYLMRGSEYFRIGVERMGRRWLATMGDTDSVHRTLYGAKMAAERRWSQRKESGNGEAKS